MALSFYAGLAIDVDGLLKEFGQTITITRTVEGEYDPDTSSAPQTTIVQTPFGVELDYDIREVDGTNILREDKRVLISSLNVTEPQVGDVVSYAGKTATVQNCSPLAPAGTVLYYELQVRE